MGRSWELHVTCNERQDLIFLYAADQLESAETEELRRRMEDREEEAPPEST